MVKISLQSCSNCYGKHARTFTVIHGKIIKTPFNSLNHRYHCKCSDQRLAAGRWFAPGIPVSSTNKTDQYDITEILLKVALSTINHTKQNVVIYMYIHKIIKIIMRLEVINSDDLLID